MRSGAQCHSRQWRLLGESRGVKRELSYSGENRTARIYRTTVKGYEDVRFIKVGKHLCYIDEDSSVLEKATGESHPEAERLVEVLRAEA